MRASRLLSILLLLQTRGRMTAQALADEMEVSVRTIYRDVESLGAAGVPIYADRGPAGGYQLLDGYRTRLTGLTPDEAESLFLAGMPGPAAELGLGTVLATAQLKLLAALPPELRSRAGRIRERFHLDAPGWFQDAEQPPYLAEVADALWNQRQLWVRYRRWGGEVERTIEPLGVVLKGAVWYVVAQVSGQPRTYRVARILELRTLEGHFERPESFDLATFWEGWTEQFLPRLYRQEVRIRVSPFGQELLPYLFDRYVVDKAQASAGSPDAAGWVEMTLLIESPRHAPYHLLKFGAEAEVVGPPELREKVVEAVAALGRIYEAAGTGESRSRESRGVEE